MLCCVLAKGTNSKEKCMSLEFCSFASGSSGNCYMVKSQTTVLLVDVGISGKKIFEGIAEKGLEKDAVEGIMITHEHVDHIKSLRIVTKKCASATVYSNISTWQYIQDVVPEERQIVFETGREFTVGDIGVKAFKTFHDAAEPVGYSFYHGGRQVSILTDTGRVSEEMIREIHSADLLALEANHDPDVLQFCGYPYHIKRRILGDLGHLSNEAAGDCICRILEKSEKRRRILLSHLSKENNTPDMAKITIENLLECRGVKGMENLEITVLRRDGTSPLYEV